MVGNKLGNLVIRVSISARKLAADQAMVSLCPYDQAMVSLCPYDQAIVSLCPYDQAIDI